MKKADFILVFTVMCIGICLMLGFKSDSKGETAEIYVNGTLYGRYPLSNAQTIDVHTDYGQNTVCIQNNCACVTESSCKDKIEIQTGEISKKGESLICLPNHFMLVISGKGELERVSY